MERKEGSAAPTTIQATENWRGELAVVQAQDAGGGEWETLGENGGNGAERGSLVHITEKKSALHLPNGKFAPGHPGMGGRPKRKQEEAFIDAAADVFSPAEYTFYLRKALEIALDNNSTRGIILVLDHIRDTAFGKPQQRVKKDVNNFHHLVNALLSGEPAQEERKE